MMQLPLVNSTGYMHSTISPICASPRCLMKSFSKIASRSHFFVLSNYFYVNKKQHVFYDQQQTSLLWSRHSSKLKKKLCCCKHKSLVEANDAYFIAVRLALRKILLLWRTKIKRLEDFLLLLAVVFLLKCVKNEMVFRLTAISKKVFETICPRFAISGRPLAMLFL